MDVDCERAASPSTPIRAFGGSSGGGSRGHSGSGSEGGASPAYGAAWTPTRGSARGKRRRSVSPTSGHEGREGGGGLSGHRPFVRARTHTPTLPDAYPAPGGSTGMLAPHYSQVAGGSRIDAVWSAPPQTVSFGDAAMDECDAEAPRRDVELGESASSYSRWTLPRVRQDGVWGALFDAEFDAERLDGHGMVAHEAGDRARALAPERPSEDAAMRDDDLEMDLSPPMPPFQRWAEQVLPPPRVLGSASHALPAASAAHVPSRPSPLGWGLSGSSSSAMRQSMPSSPEPAAHMRRRVSASFEALPGAAARAMFRAGSWGRALPQPPSSAPLPSAWRHPFPALPPSAWSAEGGTATASLDRTDAHAQLVGADAAQQQQGMARPSSAEQTLRAGMLSHPRWRHLAPQHLSPD